MGGTDKLVQQQRQQDSDPKRNDGQPKKQTFAEKLRKKLAKLKKEDPNIYPFF